MSHLRVITSLSNPSTKPNVLEVCLISISYKYVRGNIIFGKAAEQVRTVSWDALPVSFVSVSIFIFGRCIAPNCDLSAECCEVGHLCLYYFEQHLITFVLVNRVSVNALRI
jgi:hypothetical protein